MTDRPSCGSGRKRRRPLCGRMSPLVVVVGLATVGQDLPRAGADFVYPTFNITHGLTFVGYANTTSCVDVPALRYSEHQGGIVDQSDGSLPEQTGETLAFTSRTRYDTALAQDQAEINAVLAGFGHRKTVEPAISTECPVRLRLVPSLPNKAGAVWYNVPVPVLRGFETMFTFQITDHSRVCTEHSDPLFSSTLHKTCSVRGGDGLAFVMHRDPRELATLGSDGAGMGYAGIETSLAVEFDVWYNAQADSTDYIYDHIAIHGSGKLRQNTWTSDTELSIPKVPKLSDTTTLAELADGQQHLVKIRYYPRLATEYQSYFSATEALKEYIKDNGENRRIGTLVVWFDEGLGEDKPLVAIPMNLSVLVDVPAAGPGGMVYVGFTAATGRAWAKHDVLSWYWCHENSCEAGREDEWKQFDLHQSSKYYATQQLGEYTPDMRES